MLSRNEFLKSNRGTICTPVAMTGADGKRRKIQAADTKGILRIIQSIPSPWAEPFKQWLAQVGSDWIDETVDPELFIAREGALTAKVARRQIEKSTGRSAISPLNAKKVLVAGRDDEK